MAASSQLQQDPREALAQLEVGHTDVSRAGVAVSLAVFLVALLSVPVTQLVSEWRRGATIDQWGVPLPASVAILHLIPTTKELTDAVRGGGIAAGLRAVNTRVLSDIHRYEDTLEKDSIVVATTIPPAQTVLTGWLKAGNENAICGKDGWLFYRPDLDYSTRPGFLDPTVLEARRSAGNETTDAPEPDPVAAIVEFAKALDSRGIELIVFPAPAKSSIHAERLSRSYDGLRSPVQNTSFEEFKRRLGREGVTVFDPAPALAANAAAPAYLATDTHWTADAAVSTAKALAEFLRNHAGISPAMDARYRATAAEITNVGDVAAMLKLPGVERFYPPETVTLRQISDNAGAKWKPDPTADVLFLGDSFANIYSLSGMGWGESAGFVEQLSYELQLPIDAIRMNDDGSFATRRELDRQLREGQDRLAGKRVVIYEFAARELAAGDWKTGYTFELGRPAHPERTTKTEDGIVVRGTVSAAAKTPQPGTVPYRDCIIGVHLTKVQPIEGAFSDGEALVFVWGMLDNQRQPAADWRAGQEVTLELLPWSGVSDDFGSYNRIELDDDALLLLEPYWAVLPGAVPGAPPAANDPLRTAQTQDTPAAPTTSAGGASNAEFVAELSRRVESLETSGSVVLRGLDDWLFFKNELRHLSVGPFWGDAAKSVSGATNPEYADPLAAIVDFNGQLKAANIELIVVPVPPKTVIYPEKIFTGIALENGIPPRLDGTLQEFYGVLRDHGVNVLDLTDAMLAARAAGTQMFCRQDTHYSGEACALFAREIARQLAGKPWLSGVPRTEYSVTGRTREITGDLWQFLQDTGLKKEELPLQFVTRAGASAEAVEPWRESPVLLLGDSHCLVFHEGGDMHAAGAGLPDLLAKELGFPADLVAVRGSGATPARMNLVRRRDNLSGKKVVIWCFTAREFTEAPGGWRLLPVVQPD